MPKSGGGLYWCDDDPDMRDFRLGYEISDKIKRRVLGDVIRRLQSRNWLAEDKKKLSIEELIDEAMASDPASVMKRISSRELHRIFSGSPCRDGGNC